MKKEKKNDYTFIYDKWNEVVRLTVEYFVYLSKSEFLTVDETMTNYMIRLMLLKKMLCVYVMDVQKTSQEYLLFTESKKHNVSLTLLYVMNT